MTDRPAASLPAGSAPEAEFFLARTEEQRRFRELLRSQVGLSRRRKLLNKIGLMRDDREPDPHPDSPWIFLFYGEGGMGKSTLLKQLQAIAEGKLVAQNPGDRAWVGQFTILKIDWETERSQRPSLQGPRDQIAESAVLDVLFDCAAPLDQSCFKDYEQRLKDLKAASEKVSNKLQTEQQGGNAVVSKALAIFAKAGLRWLKFDDVVKDYGDQIDAATEAATELAPQVKAWLRDSLERPELEVFERPDQVLADALGKGLAKLAARKPVLMFLDTYEVVDHKACDAVVRLVMKAAGGRVSWVVAGRTDLRKSGTRGGIYFSGYGNDFPEAKVYDKALDQFGKAEIREYFARKVPDRPIDDADARAIGEFSLGIPLVVAEIVSIWHKCPQLSWQQILVSATADEAQTPRDQVIATMTERFLFHCLQQGRDEAARTALTQDLAAIYCLAIVRPPHNRKLLQAMLQTDDLSATLANLQKSYSFVFADEFRLHDNLLAYLRPYLLAAARRESPAVQGLNDRALEHLNERLATKRQELPELGDQFESENAKALWLDAAHHHFWKAQDPDRDETAAWQFWLGVFVDAWLGDRLFAYKLVQVLGGFERCLSPDGRRRYERFKGDWYKKYEFDCDARKALLDELDKLARRGWLVTDQHPERAATLELERARLFYGQKQDSAALQALAALDRRWADPSPALREAIADLYDDLACRFLWPKSDTRAVSSTEGLQAAQRACALQPDHAWYLNSWAVALNEAKRHEEAIEIYQQAINLDPNNSVFRNNLGNAYLGLKWYEEAIAAYRQASALDPNNAIPHNGLGNAYRNLKRCEEAIVSFQQAIELDPNLAIAHSNLGAIYLNSQSYNEAITSCQRAIELDPNLALAHSNLGGAYTGSQRYGEAITSCQRAIELDPSLAMAHSNLGATYLNSQRYDEAITSCQRAIELDQNLAQAHSNLGAAYTGLQRYDEAITSCQRAIELDPNLAQAHSNLGLMLEKLQRYPEAEAAYRQSLSIEESARDFQNLGNILKAQERFDEAITAFQSAAKTEPTALRYNNVGNAYLNLKCYDEAIVSFQQAIELDPNLAMAYSNLGGAYLNSQRYDEAITSCQRAIELDPNLAQAHSNLGAAYTGLQRYDEAITSCQRAIELDQNLAQAHSNLGGAYLNSQRYDEAITSCQRAIELDPNLALAHSNLGGAYTGLQRYDEAITGYQRAIELDPKLALAHRNLGLTLEKLQRYPEAEAAHRQALSIEERAFDFRNLGDVLKAQELYNEAIEAYQRGIDLDPQNTSPYFGLGLLQFEQGELAGAIVTFQKAAELDPNDFNLPGNLGFLHLVTDRLDEAETYLLKARELKPDYYMPAFNLAAVRALRSDLDSARSLLAESLQLCPRSDDQEQLHWAIISILLGNVEAGFEQLTNTLATLANPTAMWPIRGGVLEASQAIARSPLQTPDLHRAIERLQSHARGCPTD